MDLTPRCSSGGEANSRTSLPAGGNSSPRLGAIREGGRAGPWSEYLTTTCALCTPKTAVLPSHQAVILSWYFLVSVGSYNWFDFSMFSALVEKKSLLRPFVFNKFSGLGLSPPDDMKSWCNLR
jgi:hypothetical protein